MKGVIKMAKKKFLWNNFSYEFIHSIVYGNETPVALQPKIQYKENECEFLIPYINRICSYPDEAFIRKYRKVIEDYFLDGTNHLVQVVKRLERLNYGGINSEHENMLFQLRQKKMTQTLCDVYLSEIRLAGKEVYDEESMFRFPKTIDLTIAGNDTESLLYNYQEDAIVALNKYYLEEDKQSGILSMPTGSGKTRTSVCFLLHDMISKGYQVIWLCHRFMLIEQAAEQFYRFAPIIKDGNEDKEQFKIVCVSGKHASVRALQKDDDLIVASVKSLCNNTMYLSDILSKKVIIVVDEAHHTSAKSYKRIIKAIRDKRPEAKLLGLTATPVRLTEKATIDLMHIFDNKIIYSVAMSKLIADGTLATPNYIPVETNMDIESIIELDEREYIQKWGELPETLVEKVAKTNERNDIIVDEYVHNREKYGKTIIFALNAIHCDTLNELFHQKGIRSGYVYTLAGDAENQRTIDRFYHNDMKDGIDVLININILTEGSDIPDIQTVFLTRPTTSDVLLMQMVGRGMRGSGCGGTDMVNIVDFCDKWSSITSWLNPQIFFGEETPGYEENIHYSRQNNFIPFDAIRDIVKGITYKGEYSDSRQSTLPIGWYDVIDEEGNDIKVLVFENQLSGYEKFKDEFMEYLDLEGVTAKELLTKYFKTFGMLPKESELGSILYYIKQERAFPELEKFDVRKQIEPFSLSEKIRQDNLGFLDIEKMIQDTYSQNKQIILSLYGSFEYYKKRIFACMMFPKGIIPIGTYIEEIDKEVYQLSTEPLEESINELLSEVVAEQAEHFPADFIKPEIYWTEKPVGSYFGMYYHDYNMIYINSLLNSVSIPKEVVKYVIYHECLHQEFKGHPREFRVKERLYPKFQEYENFLDYKLQDFDVKEAM